MNQCDGCRRGMPLFPTLSGGVVHKGDGRWDLIGCTKHLYEGEQQIADVWHEGSKSFYRAQLLEKLTPEQALHDPTESVKR